MNASIRDAIHPDYRPAFDASEERYHGQARAERARAEREQQVFSRRANAIGFLIMGVVWAFAWWPLSVLMVAGLLVWFTARVMVG